MPKDYNEPDPNSEIGQFRKRIRAALFDGDTEALSYLEDLDYYRDGEFGGVLRNTDWEDVFSQEEHQALVRAETRLGKKVADDPEAPSGRFFRRNLDESFRDFENIAEWVYEVQEGNFFDQVGNVYRESGATPPSYLDPQHLKTKTYAGLASHLGRQRAAVQPGSGSALRLDDRLQELGRRAQYTEAELDAAERGDDVTNTDTSPADAFTLPEGVLPQHQAFVQRAIHELGAADAANFFAAMGIDLNRPREADIHAREDAVREDQQTQQRDLQDDAQTQATNIQNDEQAHEIELTNIVQGHERDERTGTQNFQRDERIATQGFEREQLDRQGEIQEALTRITSGAEGRDNLQFVRDADGRWVLNNPSTDRDLDRLSNENIANTNRLAQTESARLASGNNFRNLQNISHNDDGTFRVESSNQLTENDLQRNADERLANIQAGLVNDRAGTVRYEDRQSEERVAGVADRQGVKVNADGTITLTPGQITDRDLDRAVQTHIANIQAGLTTHEEDTEREADRDLQRDIANIQSGQSADDRDSVNYADRQSRENVARIQQGYVEAEDGTEAAADRDLARDVADRGITSPYGYAASDNSISRLQAALAAQSTGGVAGTAGAAREFHTDQARIQASGGLSDPEQIARIQILDTINNPYAFVENYLQQQAQLQAEEQARTQRVIGNRAADQFGTVGPSEQLGINQPRQTLPGGNTGLDPAVAEATELLRQTQLANAAPEIRQQNIDLISNPQSLGAAVQLGGTDYVQQLLGITSQFTGAGASAKGGESGPRASEGGQFLDPYVNNDNGLREAIELFNNDKIMTDGRQLFTRDTLGSFNQRPGAQQGFLTGAAAGAGITPDQLYKGLRSNTPNARDNQFASTFRTA